MIYISCGYNGTGSSALVHLLSEYSNCTTGNLGKYEHILFYTPNGLFDLEDRLLLNNSIHGADGAISEFRKAMERLSECDFGWFGGLRRRYGNRFEIIVNEFIEEIVDYRMPGYWSYDFELKFSLPALAKQSVQKLMGKKVDHYGYRISRKGDGVVLYSFIQPERFYSAAKKMITSYLSLVSDGSNKCFVCDQLFQPHHLKRLARYFSEDEVRVVVFDRDPRDMFIISKYIYPRFGLPDAFPQDAKEYALFFSSLINSAEIPDSKCILKIHFEDLIYFYEETVKKLEQFFGDKIGNHTRMKQVFVPEKSIHNTQNYLIKPEWCEEVVPIAEIMKDSLYSFPYKVVSTVEETSDP